MTSFANQLKIKNLTETNANLAEEVDQLKNRIFELELSSKTAAARDLTKLLQQNHPIHPQAITGQLAHATTTASGGAHYDYDSIEVIDRGETYLATFNVSSIDFERIGDIWIEYTDYLTANHSGRVILWYTNSDNEVAFSVVEFEGNVDESLWISRGDISYSAIIFNGTLDVVLHAETPQASHSADSVTIKTFNNVTCHIYGESIFNGNPD